MSAVSMACLLRACWLLDVGADLRPDLADRAGPPDRPNVRIKSLVEIATESINGTSRMA